MAFENYLFIVARIFLISAILQGILRTFRNSMFYFYQFEIVAIAISLFHIAFLCPETQGMALWDFINWSSLLSYMGIFFLGIIMAWFTEAGNFHGNDRKTDLLAGTTGVILFIFLKILYFSLNMQPT